MRNSQFRFFRHIHFLCELTFSLPIRVAESVQKKIGIYLIFLNCKNIFPETLKQLVVFENMFRVSPETILSSSTQTIN